MTKEFENENDTHKGALLTEKKKYHTFFPHRSCAGSVSIYSVKPKLDQRNHIVFIDSLKETRKKQQKITTQSKEKKSRLNEKTT